MLIKKGNPVEFLREPKAHVEVGNGEFGIATEDENSDGSVQVELSDGSFFQARHIIAYAWGGWLPEELEKVYLKHNPDSFDFEDY